MGIRWRTYHVVLLTFSVLCNSQRVPLTQPSLQHPRTLRQQNVPFSGRGSNFRTAEDQFRRPTIRRPASHLSTEPKLPLPNNRATFHFRNQNNQPFPQFVRQPAPNSQTQGLNQQSFQNFQNPTPPSISQSLPKQTFQRIQILQDSKPQQIPQGISQARFQSSQQLQGFTQQKEPNLSFQIGNEKLISQHAQTLPSVQQHRFLGVQPKMQPFSSIAKPAVQQQSQFLQTQNRFQEPQRQIQQTFHTLPPPPQLPQSQTIFQEPQRQTQQTFHTLAPPPQLPQSETRFQESQRQTQQTFHTLAPPPQLPQSETRFQESQRQTQQTFHTLAPPPQLPQSETRFQESQRQTQQTFHTLAPPLQLPQSETRFQEPQRQTQQTFHTLAPPPQLPQSETRFKESQRQTQQTFHTLAPPPQLPQSETRFHEPQRQTQQTFPTLPPPPQLPHVPQPQTRFQETQHLTEQRFATLPRSHQELRSQNKFQESQRQTFPSSTPPSQSLQSQTRFLEAQRQTHLAFATLPPPPQLPQVSQSQTRFQEKQHQTEQRFSNLPRPPQVLQSQIRIQEGERQTKQTFSTPPPPPQLPQTLQSQTRFQEAQHQTEQFPTVPPPSEFPQQFQVKQMSQFPGVQRQTPQHVFLSQQPTQFPTPQTTFQEKQTPQTFQLTQPKPQKLKQHTAQLLQQEFQASQRPHVQQFHTLQNVFPEAQHQTQKVSSVAQSPPQQRVQAPQPLQSQHFSRTQSEFQEQSRSHQTLSTLPPLPNLPNPPKAQLRGQSDLEAETEDAFLPQFQSSPHQTSQSQLFSRTQNEFQERRRPQQSLPTLPPPPKLPNPPKVQLRGQSDLEEETEDAFLPQFQSSPHQTSQSQLFSRTQNEFQERRRPQQSLPTLPPPPKLPNPPKVQLRGQSDLEEETEDAFLPQFQSSPHQTSQSQLFSRTQNEFQERRRPQQSLPTLPPPPKLPNPPKVQLQPQSDLEVVSGLPEDKFVPQFQNTPQSTFQSQHTSKSHSESQKRRRPQHALSILSPHIKRPDQSKFHPQTHNELGTIVVQPQDSQFQNPVLFQTTQFIRPQNEFKESQQVEKTPTEEQQSQKNIFQSPQEQTLAKPHLHKRLKSVKKPLRLAHRGNKHRAFQTPQPQPFQQSNQLSQEDLSASQKPKHIIRVLDPQQKSEQFQQRGVQPQLFDSRKIAFQQQEQQVDHQLSSPRSQNFPATAGQEFTSVEDEAAQIRQRFQLQRQQQSEDLPDVRTRHRGEEPSEEADESDQQAGNAMYSFSSSVKDTIHDNQVTREETRDGKKVSGSYSYSDGFVMRTVHYEADEKGYRIVKEETEPIGQGPVEDIDGTAEVISNVGGSNLAYSITADDVPLLAKLRDEP